jgi:hypothetical protein
MNAVIESGDIPLPDLLHKVAADCPKMDALGNDPCGACYWDLPMIITLAC